MKKLVWWLIRAYQLTFSAFLGRHCRFHPSCSHYAQEAILKHGVLEGLVLAVWRFLRCNPWGGQGFDPVPEDGVSGRLRRSRLFAKLLKFCGKENVA